jgi:ketosteroid isomerase-like protein
MTLPLLTLALGLGCFGVALEPQPVPEHQPAVVQTSPVDFAQIEQQLARAWVDSDRATIDRIIASDWTTIAITGRLLTRAEVMADFFRDGKSPIASMTIDDVRVRLLGDVAIVTGRTTARAIGSEASIVLRFTDVFALRNGRWQIVASQGTRTAP